MDGTKLVDAAAINPGDSFRFNGEWLDVFIAARTPAGMVLLTTDDDRQFIAHPQAKRRVVVAAPTKPTVS